MLFFPDHKSASVNFKILVFEISLVLGLKSFDILDMLFFEAQFELLHL